MPTLGSSPCSIGLVGKQTATGASDPKKDEEILTRAGIERQINANVAIQVVCAKVRMIQLGEVTPQTRTYLRGLDGGSENDNLASLALNSTLVKVASGPPHRKF